MEGQGGGSCPEGNLNIEMRKRKDKTHKQERIMHRNLELHRMLPKRVSHFPTVEHLTEGREMVAIETKKGAPLH